jgi:hypothetical protein
MAPEAPETDPDPSRFDISNRPDKSRQKYG